MSYPLETATEREALIGGWVTAPVGERFGIRLALDGGIEGISDDLFGGSPSRSLLNAGGDIFIRDPNKGYVQLGTHAVVSSTITSTPGLGF